MNIKEIRTKTDEELAKELKNRKEELFRLRFRKITDVVENPSLLREIRKGIARMKTVLRERNLKQGGKQNGQKANQTPSQKETSPKD